jgi:outer membrane protein assembly factor BamB
MKNAILTVGVPVCCAILFGANSLCAQDWPQWRGPDRTAKATGFKAPKEWPKELTQKWKVTVGDGVATPALVGDKLYVFSRESGNEVIRCLNAADGKETWQDKYEAAGANGPAIGFPGPRSSPTVVDGKVVTLGVQGTLSCYDVSGKNLWRKDDFKGTHPQFFVSSSPIVVDGLCIAQMGGESKGAIVAYDLATGDEKWKWARDGTAYASPSLLISGGTKVIVAETAKSVVGVNVADGKLLWEMPFAPGGRMNYNSASPMVEGETVIYAGSGRPATAVKMEKKGDGLAATEIWSNKDNPVSMNTPVLKNGLIFGFSSADKLFCIDNATGKTAWTSEKIPAWNRPGYGSIVDAGAVLLALTPAGKLLVFEPTAKEFKQLASYKVGADTFAYPIVSGNRIFIKDKDSLILWTIPPGA